MAASQGDHLKVMPGTMVHGHYEVLREVGCGNFSKVYEVRDTRVSESSPHLALKIVKREYANDANFERDMLKVLGIKGLESKGSSEGAASVSTMREFFVWNQFPCFIMPLRGPTLRSCKLGIDRGHCTRNNVVRLAHSLLTALKFVHFDCKMVHTDLKPENVLLNEAVCATREQADGHPAEGALGASWTICDFGSASLWRADRMDSDLISTRPYRAPEVVLGNPWSYPADTWSLGCILYEVAVGTRLFDVHDDNTHLSFMEKRLGKLPETLAKKSKNSKKYFDPSGNLNRPVRAAQGAACRAIAATRAPRTLQEVLGDDPELLDLISSMLHYDPSTRIRADDALLHPIFSMLSSSTEKVKPASQCTSNVPSAHASRVTTPEPPVVRVTQKLSPPPPTSIVASTTRAASVASTKYRAPIALLACAAAMDAKENATANKLKPSLMKAGSSSGLTTLARASSISAQQQRSGSATAMRPTGQLVASQRTKTHVNYALRLKVNART